MHGKATKYLIVESTGSAVVNGFLNFGAAFLIFHGRSQISASGPAGVVRDSIGETFLVTSLSYLVAALISRQRRRGGTLPAIGGKRPLSAGNLYLRSFVVGLVFTAIFVPCDAWLLPRLFPNGFSFKEGALFKTFSGAILGFLATSLAIYKALNEVNHLPEPSSIER